MIGLLLVYGTDRADVDRKDEKKQMDILCLIINYISEELYIKYLSIDIYYP